VIFAFRGIRRFQALLAVAALLSGVGCVLALRGFTEGRGTPLIFIAIILGAVFLWAFATTLAAPTSFVAIAEERTRIRFAGFVDTVVANDSIVEARLVRRSLLWGIGVRTNFRGHVALLSSWGEAVELTFQTPVRIWLVPRLVPVRAERLTLSVRNPARLVEHFTPAPGASHTTRIARKVKSRGSRTR
jgi:hypothetical protein